MAAEVYMRIVKENRREYSIQAASNYDRESENGGKENIFAFATIFLSQKKQHRASVGWLRLCRVQYA